jgi:hypothetical protein
MSPPCDKSIALVFLFILQPRERISHIPGTVNRTYKANTNREKQSDIPAEGDNDQIHLLINWSGYRQKSSHVKTACLQSVSPEFVLDLRDEQPVSSNSL